MIKHTFDTPKTVQQTVTGFSAEKVDATGDGRWRIRAELHISGDPAPGVERRPVKYEIEVDRAEISNALGLGLDTEADDFDEQFKSTVTAGQLEQGIIAAAVGKVLG